MGEEALEEDDVIDVTENIYMFLNIWAQEYVSQKT